jgi:thiol-disulfide isomerase/thioredoxin
VSAGQSYVEGEIANGDPERAGTSEVKARPAGPLSPTALRVVLGALVLLALGLVALAAAGGLGPARAGSGAIKDGPAVGSLAPDFDLVDAITGQRVRLSALRGKPVWINFWATWCEACKTEMPRIEKTIQARGGDLVVLGVDVQESPANVKKYVEAGRFSWVFPVDPDGKVVDRYMVYGLPTHFFVGRDGAIKAEYVGELDESGMAKYLDLIVK